ncbi:MAG: hypothetical protein K8R21_10030 [Leptospira sp.]|nr:hypothetical protein [Leptospira sp.]
MFSHHDSGRTSPCGLFAGMTAQQYLILDFVCSDTLYDVEKEKQCLINPQQYVELLSKSKLSGSEKAYTSIEWKRATGYTTEEIKKARSQNDFWKTKQRKSADKYRTKRLAENNFLSGASAKHLWTPKELHKFYLLNEKGNTDVELARVFRTSVPAVYSVRRKFSMAKSLLIQMKRKPNSSNLVDMASGSEAKLRLTLRELKKPKKKSN